MLIFSHRLKRRSDGTFNDGELASIIKDACVVLLDSCGRFADETAELNIQPQPLVLVALPIA